MEETNTLQEIYDMIAALSKNLAAVKSNLEQTMNHMAEVGGRLEYLENLHTQPRWSPPYVKPVISLPGESSYAFQNRKSQQIVATAIKDTREHAEAHVVPEKRDAMRNKNNDRVQNGDSLLGGI